MLVQKLPTGEKRVFTHLPRMKRFRLDLKAAGIPFIDDNGFRADFHALRYTLATNLARAGTAPRVAMEIMRHSDMRLTTKTYTDTGLLPLTDAVVNLPSLLKPVEPSTQIGTQNLFRDGHDLSVVGVKKRKNASLEVSNYQQNGQQENRPVMTGQETEKIGVTGFEPATSWSQTRRSTKLSYTPLYFIVSKLRQY